MAETSLARRRARTGSLRGLVHLVPVAPDDGRPAWRRLDRTALCGFTARRFWSDIEPPEWESDCPRCLARQVSR